MNKNFSKPLSLKDISITDGFWTRAQELVRLHVLPYQWEAMNDRVAGAEPGYCMHNFKAAAAALDKYRENPSSEPKYVFRDFRTLPDKEGQPEDDKFYGFVFQDSDAYKWIEAVGYSLIVSPDPDLERLADGAIDLICAAQADNGYLDTYYILNGMNRAFTHLRDHHELYCMGHMIEGAIAYYAATGKDKLLRAAMRFADLACERFGKGKCEGYPGHEIAELALARLYELTGEERYLTLARYFIDARGQKPYYFDIEAEERARYEGARYRPNDNPTRYAYYQAHVPVREQSEAVGHAVRAVYLYSGMADVARLTGDESLHAACERLWQSITRQKLYITGGIGATHIGEAFSYPNDLPNDTAYSETCAAIGLVFFARRMLAFGADSRYSDVMEQALYNTVLAGMSLDGTSFFYVNPLETDPTACERDERKEHVKAERQKWFGCACCPPNIARMVGSLGAYAYTEDDDTLYAHLYVAGSAVSRRDGEQLRLIVQSRLPWEGTVRLCVSVDRPARRSIALRIPGWSAVTHVSLPASDLYGARAELTIKDGVILYDAWARPRHDTSLKDGYLYISGEWRDCDAIEIRLDMSVRCVRANTRVREDAGRCAFMRGPLCYCAEEADNGGNLHLLKVDLKRAGVSEGCSGVSVEKSDAFGHETRTLRVPGIREAQDGEGALYADYAAPSCESVSITYVPYYAWSNRGRGEMSVWLRAE